MSKRLQTYLEKARGDEWGWQKDYDIRLNPPTEAWLAGWYRGMLDEMVSAIGGPDAALALLAARERLAAAAADLDAKVNGGA